MVPIYFEADFNLKGAIKEIIWERFCFVCLAHLRNERIEGVQLWIYFELKLCRGTYQDNKHMSYVPTSIEENLNHLSDKNINLSLHVQTLICNFESALGMKCTA